MHGWGAIILFKPAVFWILYVRNVSTGHLQGGSGSLPGFSVHCRGHTGRVALFGTLCHAVTCTAARQRIVACTSPSVPLRSYYYIFVWYELLLLFCWGAVAAARFLQTPPTLHRRIAPCCSTQCDITHLHYRQTLYLHAQIHDALAVSLTQVFVAQALALQGNSSSRQRLCIHHLTRGELRIDTCR